MWVCVGTDYEMVLKLEPGNFEAQNEVKKIRQVNVKQPLKEFRVIFHISSFSVINVFGFFLSGFRFWEIRTLPPRAKPHSRRRLPHQTQSSRD